MNIIRIYSVGVLFFIAFSLQAQVNGVDKYFESFKDDDRFTTVSVSSKMFSLFVNFERNDPTEQQVIDIMSKLKGLKVLIGQEIDDAKSQFKNMISRPARDMEELMELTDATKHFKFYINESNGNISELMMVGYEKNQLVILSLVGDINLKEIALLSKKMDIKGFEHLQQIDQ